MKALLVILTILMYQNQSVSATFMDFISTAFEGFKNAFADVFNDIKGVFTGFKNNEEPSYTENTQTTWWQLIEKQQYNKFDDKLGTTDTESETETSENSEEKHGEVISTPELAALHGKEVESHIVHTLDGYQLTLHRVVSQLNHNITKSPNKTVILHHGLLGSSADWILLGPKKSLPYLLSDAGYDVWMANARGNYYSRKHNLHPVDSDKFWRFSWQEIGEFDLPAAIDYIRDNTNTSEPINYIGHSMGATAFLVLMSMNPKYNEFCRIGILLAPLAIMSKIEGPLKLLTVMSSSPPKQLLELLVNGEFLPSRKIPNWLATMYCHGSMTYCRNPLFFFAGGIPQTVIRNSSFTSLLLEHVPAGASTDTMMHYAQVIENGIFHKFNDISSEFPLGQVTVPIALISSRDDWLASVPDVLKLYFSIANPINHYVISDKNFSHTDFVWGAEADVLVFSKVLEYLENGLDKNFIETNEISNQPIL